MIKALTYSLHNQSSSPPECEFASIMNNAGQDNIEFNESNSDLPQEENEENAIFSSLNLIDLNAYIHQPPVNRSIDDIVVMPKRVTSKPRSLANLDPRTSCETNISNVNNKLHFDYSKTFHNRGYISRTLNGLNLFDGKSNKICNLTEIKNAPTKTQHSSMKNSPEKYLSSETTQSSQVGNLSNQRIYNNCLFTGLRQPAASIAVLNARNIRGENFQLEIKSFQNEHMNAFAIYDEISNREFKTVNDRTNIKGHIFNSASSEIRSKDFQIENIPKSTYQYTKTCILMPSHISFSLAPNTLHLPTLNVQYGSLNYVSSTYWQYPRINTYKVYFSKRNFIFEFENDTLTSLFEGHNERS
ncbi:hypothetical protein [Vibrio cholerae]|uniref:hypothetical protein n=3 Tax=Vibrio cholerae TaxID=666 RepID=UPI000E6C3007|nr:hypothetical protein [Vibrio cholerae]RJK82844.1 hypothetical protein CHN45_17180 [Vibrio cholerae]